MNLTRDGRTYTLTCEQWLPLSPRELFPFFSDAYNLETLTPASVRFHVVTPRPIVMRVGAMIDYKLRIRGLPVSWQSRIVEWDPPRGFVDEQVKGPYRLWRHAHRFEEKQGGTLCLDRVDYQPPGGPLAGVVNRLFVRNDVQAIFAYRGRKLRELFGSGAVGHDVRATGGAGP